MLRRRYDRGNGLIPDEKVDADVAAVLDALISQDSDTDAPPSGNSRAVRSIEQARASGSGPSSGRDIEGQLTRSDQDDAFANATSSERDDIARGAYREAMKELALGASAGTLTCLMTLLVMIFHLIAAPQVREATRSAATMAAVTLRSTSRPPAMICQEVKRDMPNAKGAVQAKWATPRGCRTRPQMGRRCCASEARRGRGRCGLRPSAPAPRRNSELPKGHRSRQLGRGRAVPQGSRAFDPAVILPGSRRSSNQRGPS